MAWSFSTDRPIFQQIADIIVLKIISGEYPPGYRLNAVQNRICIKADSGICVAHEISGA